MPEHMQIVDGGVSPHAAAADFGEVFNEEMHSLYLLSFLLTGDKDKAEQCFIGALGECLEGMDAFMEWARLWARRAIIRQAIRMVTHPGGHRSVAARPCQKGGGPLAKQQHFGRHRFTQCL